VGGNLNKSNSMENFHRRRHHFSPFFVFVLAGDGAAGHH
jgi:hypothetical protein